MTIRKENFFQIVRFTGYIVYISDRILCPKWNMSWCMMPSALRIFDMKSKMAFCEIFNRNGEFIGSIANNFALELFESCNLKKFP